MISPNRSDMTKYKRGLDYLWTSNQSIFVQNIKDTWISVKFVNLVRYRVAPIVWEDDQYRFTEASEGEKTWPSK